MMYSDGCIASTDPATGTWTATGNLNTARHRHTATLLPSGMVLIAGGQDATFNAIASAELYDPVSGSWTATGNLNTARWSHTATLLSDDGYSCWRFLLRPGAGARIHVHIFLQGGWGYSASEAASDSARSPDSAITSCGGFATRRLRQGSSFAEKFPRTVIGYSLRPP